MKELAAMLLGGSAMVAFFQWGQIIYRVHLFFGEYQGQLGTNHIGNGDFLLIYIANGILLVAAILAIWLSWKDRRWLFASAAIGATNLLGCLTLFIMHRTGVLVEYNEFIGHWKGGM